MTKKKSFISLVLAFCLIIPAMFMLTACGGNNTQTLKSDDGIAVVGEFEKGAELKTDKVELSSEDATTILGKLAGGNIVITSTDNAMIYDIFVSKDDQKVQPNGKVTVSVPVTESANGYKVFHIKGDNTIEQLSATYKDGILTFETSSFSYFVIVPTGDVLMNNPTPDTGDNTPTAGSEAEWDKAIDEWKKATNVKVVEKIVTPQSYDVECGNMGAKFTIHEYSGTAISILTYAENVAKGSKPSIILENNNETYSHYETSDNGATWNKDTSPSCKGEYEDELACRVYGWRDPGLDYGLSTPVVDFSYSNFEYDETTGAYTSKDGKEITVEFEFENDTLTKIVITKGNATNNQTTRTITFTDISIEVPTVE